MALCTGIEPVNPPRQGGALPLCKHRILSCENQPYLALLPYLYLFAVRSFNPVLNQMVIFTIRLVSHTRRSRQH